MEQNSVRRREYKYLLGESQAFDLRKRLAALLSTDPHSGPDGYCVRSLYFDTPDDTDYELRMAGVEKRKKIRLRVYSPDAEWCSLEIKLKVGELHNKRTLVISRTDAEILIGGDYSVLLNYAEGDPGGTALLLYTEMMLGCVRPVTLIEYHRYAFTYPECRTRITLDSRVMCSESDLDLFRRDPGLVPLMYDRTILELKFDGYLMKFISDILRPYNLTRMAVSKYSMGRPGCYL